MSMYTFVWVCVCVCEEEEDYMSPGSGTRKNRQGKLLRYDSGFMWVHMRTRQHQSHYMQIRGWMKSSSKYGEAGVEQQQTHTHTCCSIPSVSVRSLTGSHQRLAATEWRDQPEIYSAIFGFWPHLDCICVMHAIFLTGSPSILLNCPSNF